MPVQYSVFIAELADPRIDEIVRNLDDLIGEDEDDVGVYPLPRMPRVIGSGRGYFPGGVILLQHGRDLLVPDEAA